MKQLGQLLANPEARDSVAGGRRTRGRAARRRAGAHAWRRSSPICCSCGSRWEPPMREPAFWHRPSSWKSHLLRPLGALYGAVAGETPAAQGARRRHPRALRRQLSCRRRRQDADGAGAGSSCCASSANRRSCSAAAMAASCAARCKVDPARHAAADVGDEPLMLAAIAAGGGLARPRRGRRAGEVAGRERDPDG